MWLRQLAELAHGVAHLLYPPACLICDAPESDALRHGLCINCRHSMTSDPADVCPLCAATVGPHTDVTRGCVVCQPRSFGFDGAWRLGPYEGRLREAILRIKNASGEPLAEMLGRLVVEHKGLELKAAGVDLVVPVPLHWRRRLSRGYNQAAAIGREVAAGLGIEFRPGWLRRIRRVMQHAQPSASARRENIRGAFRVSQRASFGSRAVLLVDDVMTTGSTASEAAGVLRVAGAANVIAAVLARA